MAVAEWGLLVLCKPSGMTSHTAVRRAARALGVRKAGHAGTLDPLASGVLLVGLGKATRLLEYLVGHDKEYRAVIRLGEIRDTLDREGVLVEERRVPDFGPDEIEAALHPFRGSFHQVPPAFSAIKVGGERLYERARRGEPVVAPARQVEIRTLAALDWNCPDLTVEVSCSKGTYIRALARDVGEALGTGGSLSALERTRSGPFRVEQAVELETLEAEGPAAWNRVLPPLEMLRGLECRSVDGAGAAALAQGRRIASEPGEGEIVVLDPHGTLLAVARCEGLELQPIKVFEAL